MKKYIILAVVALLGFTSCRLSQSGIADYDGPNRVITRNIQENLRIVLEHSKYAILTDVVLSGDEQQQEIVKSKLFNDKKIEYKNDTLYIYHNNYYNIVTVDAQRVDKKSIKLERIYDGVKSHTISFYIVEDDKGCFYIDNFQVLHAQKALFNNFISYEVTDKGEVVVELWGSGVIEGLNSDYSISFSIDEDEQIVTKNCDVNKYESGVIDIEYKDFIDNKGYNFMTGFIEGYELYYK